MEDSLGEMASDPASIQCEMQSAGPVASPPGREDSLADWMHVAAGISAAGGAYPVTVFWILVAFGAIADAVDYFMFGGSPAAFNLFDALAALLAGAFFSVVIGVLGAFCTGVITLLVMPPFYLFVRSMRLRASLICLGAILGGLVGFLGISVAAAFAGLFSDTPISSASGLWEAFLFLVLGPCLTTVLGQAGGAWGGWRAGRSTEAATPADVPPPTGEGKPGPPPQPEEAAADAAVGKKPLFQFRVHHMLWLAAWIGVSLAAMRAAGVRFEVLLPAFGIWLVYQTATLYLGGQALRRLAPWWIARRRRRCT